jgi:pyruvate formate lyase activating enzyme
LLHKNPQGQPCALISNIQKYTIHDGPGIRTALFFTGCTMRCLWCSNPETIAHRPQLGIYPDKCLSLEKCDLCLRECPEGKEGPIRFENGVIKRIHMSDFCESCLHCAQACPSGAIKIWGQLMTLDEMLKIIREDMSYYRRTGGGVTLNGGEVLLQWEIAEMLLKACKRNSINTCVETALNCPTEHMEAVYRHTDLVITDIKHMDTIKHREYTGAGNELILKNIIKTIELGKKTVIRTPIVPGYNDNEENILAIGHFIRDELKNRIVQYQLLPYRKLGTEKYASLGIPYPMGDYVPPERNVWEKRLLELSDMLRSRFGIPAVAGSSGKLVL